MIPDAALARTTHPVVQDTKTVKRLYRPVIHVDGEAYVHRALRINEIVDDADLDPVDPGQCPLELLFGVLKEVQVFRRFGSL